MVNRTHHNNIIKKEDARFINNFNQAKNIIEKQMFKGKLIKERRNLKFENIQKKHITKQSRSFMSHQAIPSKVFDSYISNPLMNSSIDRDSVENYSTTINRENPIRDGDIVGRESTVYSKNFNEFPQYTYITDENILRNKSQISKRASIVSSQNPIARKSTSYIKDRMNKNSIRKKVFSKEGSVSYENKGSIRNFERIRGILSNPENDEIIDKYKAAN